MGRDDELLELNRGEPRKKRASARKKERRADGELGRKGVVDLATSPTAEHAATLLDGHARLRETSAFITATVRHMEKYGRGRIVYDMWGPHVRFEFFVKLCILI